MRLRSGEKHAERFEGTGQSSFLQLLFNRAAADVNCRQTIKRVCAAGKEFNT